MLWFAVADQSLSSPARKNQSSWHFGAGSSSSRTLLLGRSQVKSNSSEEWLPCLLPIFLDVTDHQTVEASSLFSLGNSLPLRKICCSLRAFLPSTVLAWTFGASPVSNVAPGSGSQCRAGVCNCNHFLPQLALGLAPPPEDSRGGAQVQ